jgi:hypothetical protein
MPTKITPAISRHSLAAFLSRINSFFVLLRRSGAGDFDLGRLDSFPRFEGEAFADSLSDKALLETEDLRLVGAVFFLPIISLFIYNCIKGLIY